MRIRCEHCATLYRLEDSLLPPEGAPVQCTCCGHVFLARPPNPAAEVVARPRPVAAPPAVAPRPPVTPPSPVAAPPRATVAPPPAAAAPPRATVAPPPAAAAPPPTAASDPSDPVDFEAWAAAGLEPSAAAGRTGAPDAPDPEVLAFERAMMRRRRIVVGALAGAASVALLVGLGTWAYQELGGRSHDPAAVEKLDRLRVAVRPGDPARALEAAPLGEEALAIEPAFVRAKADRGLALLVASVERRDLADRVAARRPPIERALAKAEEAGNAAAAEELRAQLGALKAEYDPLIAAYGKLKAEADEAIEGAYQGHGQDDPAAVRAMGMLRASSGDEKNAPILAKNYRKLAGDEDGWADLIEGQLFAAGRASPEKRAQAVEKLTAALERDSSFGIAYLLLGRVRLDLQDFAGARKDLGQALSAAPANELAKRWLADVDSALSAARPKDPPVVPAPTDPATTKPTAAPASAG